MHLSYQITYLNKIERERERERENLLGALDYNLFVGVSTWITYFHLRDQTGSRSHLVDWKGGKAIGQSVVQAANLRCSLLVFWMSAQSR